MILWLKSFILLYFQNSFNYNELNTTFWFQILQPSYPNGVSVEGKQSLCPAELPNTPRVKCEEIQKELLHILESFNSKQVEDAIAQSWALKLKRSPKTQRNIVEKAINEVLLEAESCRLHSNSVKINEPNSLASPSTSSKQSTYSSEFNDHSSFVKIEHNID